MDLSTFTLTSPTLTSGRRSPTFGRSSLPISGRFLPTSVRSVFFVISGRSFASAPGRLMSGPGRLGSLLPRKSLSWAEVAPPLGRVMSPGRLGTLPALGRSPVGLGPLPWSPGRWNLSGPLPPAGGLLGTSGRCASPTFFPGCASPPGRFPPACWPSPGLACGRDIAGPLFACLGALAAWCPAERLPPPPRVPAALLRPGVVSNDKRHDQG